ncbi:right-handed parallel beta-helix repeat-containing protein [Luteibacter sp. PPL552]
MNDGITLRGKNWNSSKIISSNASTKIINITGNQCALDGLSVEFSGSMPLTTNAQAISVSQPNPGAGTPHGENVSLTNFSVRNAGVCVYLGNSYVAHIGNFQLVGFGQAGLFFDNWIDAYVTQFVIQAWVAASAGQLGGIFAQNTQAIVATNADILAGAHAISLTGSSAYCYFANIYCDSSNQDPLFIGSGGANLTKFTNCWFSGGRTGGGYNGASLIQCEGIDFVNCTFVNNGNHGAFVGAGASRVSFDTCRVEGKSVTAASGTGHGISIDSGASDFMIRGCTIRNSLFGARQGYGIFFNAGASDRFIITNNLIDGNRSGAINALPANTSNWVVDDSNIGYKRPVISANLMAGWVNYGAAAATVGYIKDASGFVHLQGAAKGGSIPGTMFVLPPGYRPAATHDFAVNSNGSFGWVYVTADGNVVVASGNAAFVSLAGISFKAS